jgi:hypothetical protein
MVGTATSTEDLRVRIQYIPLDQGKALEKFSFFLVPVEITGNIPL